MGRTSEDVRPIAMSGLSDFVATGRNSKLPLRLQGSHWRGQGSHEIMTGCR